LLGSTVILVGQYGNPCRAVRYALPSAHRLKNLCFCWAFANKSLEDGWVGSKRKGEFTGRHGIFVGEYGIDLLAGTVLRSRAGLRGSARGPAARLSVRWYGVLVWLLVRYPTTRITALPVGRERTPLDAHPYGVLADAEAAGRVVDR